MTAATLFVGVGSPHGDDQVGWSVAQAIAEQNLADCEIRLARAPSDLLEPLADRTRLIVCDAIRSGLPTGTIHRWLWPTNELQHMRWSGTHDVTLPGALQLAAQLGWLPGEVILWGIEIGGTAPAAAAEESLNSVIQAVAARVAAELACKVNPAIGSERISANA